MPLLDSVRDEFADRNVLLHLLLGAVSLGRRLDVFLPPRPSSGAEGEPKSHEEADRSAGVPLDAPPATGSGGASSAEPRAPDDPLLYLVLGLISLRRTIMVELDPIRAEHAGARGAGPRADKASSAAELRLRDLLR